MHPIVAGVQLDSATFLYSMFTWRVWLAFFGCLFFLMIMLWLTRNFKTWAKKDVVNAALDVNLTKTNNEAVWYSFQVVRET